MARKPTKQELTSQIATSGGLEDITQQVFGELREMRDARLRGRADWGVYRRIALDDQVRSTFQQRRLAVTSRDWDVLPGGDDARDKAAADALKQDLEAIGWDRVTDKMLWAVLYGYAVAEFEWAYREGRFTWSKIRVRHARRFRIDKDGELRLLSRSKPQGQVLPLRKFWMFTVGGDNDDEPYGEPLAEALYWPVEFKRNGLKFWLTFLDKFGSPTVTGTYRPGTTKEDQTKLLQALGAVQQDGAIIVPEGMVISLLEAARSGTADYGEVCRYMDAAISKMVLSQTMTTDNGSSLSQARVHADVKLEVIKADADLLSDSFNAEDGPVAWWTEYNFAGAKRPRVVRIVQEEEDLQALSAVDESLDRLGWRRNDDSFQDVYGDGYERKQDAGVAAAGTAEPALASDDPARASLEGEQDARFAADDIMPLYISRPVLNHRQILAWARTQGFETLLEGEDLHVTIAYSRRPIDWMKIPAAFDMDTDGKLTVPPGGARRVAVLGDKGAVVLKFSSPALQWRHKDIRELGASWDYPEYQPHITLTYDAGRVDLDSVKPYLGPIIFGPERFEQLDPDWRPPTRDHAAGDRSIDAPEADIIDELVQAALDDAGWEPLMHPLVDPVMQALERIDSFDQLEEALIAALPAMDSKPLEDRLANASFTAWLAAATGAEQEDQAGG